MAGVKRGCVLWTGAVPAKVRRRLETQQQAEGEGRAATSFPVWLETDQGLLLPRYSPLCAKLVDLTDDEPDYAGAPDAHFQWEASMPLRPEQQPGAAKALRTLRSERGCLIRGDTGSGKTVVGMRMIYELQPRSVLVLVDQRDIAQQWGERIRKFMPSTRISFLMPESERRRLAKIVGPPIGKPSVGGVLIGTAQSLRQSTRFRPDAPLPIELLICDEVHVFGAPSFVDALFRVNYRYALGLTATDDRKDGLDWVFRQFVGFTVVPFSGRVMAPKIYALQAPDCGIVEDRWYMNFCRQKKSMTWAERCTDCAFFDVFPHDCGGDLPMKRDVVDWNGELNRSGMVSAWCTHPDYLDWLETVVDKLIEKRRRIFVFGDSREFLIASAERAVRKHGHAVVGVFLGQGRREGEPNLKTQRATALSKQVTYATYGVARKALDVPDKDAAVLATPISDARQVVGRVRRSKDGKAQPIVVVPLVPTIPSFMRSWLRIKRQFEEEAWSVIV